MKIKDALLIALLGIIPLTAPAAASPYAPIVLRSVHGTEVQIVAVYSVGPNGITFSPKPSAPLIGSNQLHTITATFDNIDITSFALYPEIGVQLFPCSVNQAPDRLGRLAEIQPAHQAPTPVSRSVFKRS